jgi:S-adenosylmethionine:tRNA ribosyltransferase-isomerase
VIAAQAPVQRPRDARLLIVDAYGHICHAARSGFVELLNPHDLVIANDAATLPASLHGRHTPSGAVVEVRLAGRRSLNTDDIHRFVAVVFGAGDFRTRTEDRPLPPTLAPDDRLELGPFSLLCSRHGLAGCAECGRIDGLGRSGAVRTALGPLSATIESLLDHPRLVSLRFDGTARDIWAGLAAHGRPIQYAHVSTPLALWDVWTPIAAMPVAFEPPSAGFVLDWASIRAMQLRGVAFATLTLAAGISSTGDAELDRRLPFDEPYRIPASTAAAILEARRQGGRIVAIGTTVVRALEHAASHDGVVHAGDGLATQRVGAASSLRVVDAILSGTHEPDSSHYQLLRAFADDASMAAATAALEALEYRTHEFGDSVLIERPNRMVRAAA